MKRIRNILLFIITILLLLSYVITEPCNAIPFSDCPNFYSQSKVDQYSEAEPEITQLIQLKIDSLVNKSIDENDFLGVSVGVYKKDIGKIVSHAGLRSKLKPKRITDNTLFRIASITKPMTAAAILALKKDSIFKIEDSINDHLEHLSIDPRITIEQLLNHTSGLPHYQSNLKSLSFKNYDSLIEASKAVEGLELISIPGSEYHYSGYGYLLLGALIERKTNLSYAEFMKANFWDSLNMIYTGINSNEYTEESNLYLKYKNTFVKSPKDNLSSKLSGGGVLSTSKDMLQFSTSILTGRILDSLRIEEIFNKRNNSGNSDYIFGWHSDSTEYGRILYHGGALSGSSSYLRIYLDQGLAIVCLSNSAFSNQEVRYLSRNISKLLLDRDGIKTNINQITNEPDQIEDWW